MDWLAFHPCLFSIFQRIHFKLPSLTKANINFATATKKCEVLTPSQPVLLHSVVPEIFTQMK